MKLLLLSAAGYSTAIGFTFGRWLLMETGEVILLLLHDDHRRAIGKENDHPNFDSMNVLENYSCVDEQHQQQHQQLREVEPNEEQSLLQNMGHTFLSIASSPILRTTILLLIVISSTTLLVGIVVLIHQFQNIKYHIISTIRNGKETFHRQVVVPTIDKMDQLVLDDIFEIIMQRGMEVCLGMFGGVLLYNVSPMLPLLGGSIGPEVGNAGEDVPSSDNATIAREVRRRILNATDPTLERLVFYPGGVWEIVSPKWRDYLVTNLTPGTVRSEQQKIDNIPATATTMTTTSVVVVDETSSENDNDDDSLDTPIVSSVPSSPPRSALERKGCTMGSDKSDNHQQQPNVRRTTTHEEHLRQQRSRGVIQPPTTTSPPTSLPPNDFHLEKILHRTSLITTILFTYHLYRSPNTRKAWGYMANSLTSLGLLSTAIGAGLVSSALRSNPSINDGIIHPIMNVIWATVMGQQQRWKTRLHDVGGGNGTGRGGGSELVVMKRIHWMFHRLRDEIQKNKRYIVAIIMLYGIGRLSRNNRVRRIGGRAP